MTTTIERRLHKLEEVLLPRLRQPVCMLSEPARDAPAEVWTEYRREIEDAKARGNFVAVVSSVRPGDRPHGEKGVTYYPNEFEARLVEASMLPSKRGNKSLLADVFEDAMGKVWGPVANPEAVEEEEDGWATTWRCDRRYGQGSQ